MSEKIERLTLAKAITRGLEDAMEADRTVGTAWLPSRAGDSVRRLRVPRLQPDHEPAGEDS